MVAEGTEEIPPEYEDETEPRPWSWVRLAGIGVAAVGNMGRALVVLADEVAGELARHDEWTRRRAFAEDVMADLDALPVL